MSGDKKSSIGHNRMLSRIDIRDVEEERNKIMADQDQTSHQDPRGKSHLRENWAADHHTRNQSREIERKRALCEGEKREGERRGREKREKEGERRGRKREREEGEGEGEGESSTREMDLGSVGQREKGASWGPEGRGPKSMPSGHSAI